MRASSPEFPLLLIGLALGLGSVAEARAASPPPGFGLALGPAAMPEALESSSDDTPCWVLLTATRVDHDAPGRLSDLLDDARARRLRTIVRIADADWQPVEAWFARLQDLARAHAGRVDAWQIFGPDAAGLTPREYAYLLKQARVALRSGGSEAAIVSAPLPRDPAWSEALYAEDAAPYLDVVAARDLDELAAVAALRERLHPRAPIWITDGRIGAERPGTIAVRDALEALAAGAAVVIFDASEGAASGAETGDGATPPPSETTESVARALVAARSLLPRGLQPAAPGALPFDPAEAVAGGGTSGEAVPLRVLAFFDPETRDGLAVYRTDATPAPDLVRLRLHSPLESLELVDPATGGVRVLASGTPPGVQVDLPLRPGALVLRYRIAAAALPINEAARVGATTELTAEEIIARERETRAIHEARLGHYEAKATISIHYRLAAIRETVDLVTENRLFVKDGVQDYEQTALYVNGSLWHGKEPPYLPYLQPETVTEVPLDIRLDERYRYRLEGRDTVEGRDCYVIGFEPARETAESLYRGRMHIDSTLFTRVRMTAVQTNLREPLRSNEVVYQFAPVDTPRGTVWLPRTINGQMTFEMLGYSLAVEREAEYTDYRPDEEGFERRRQEAYDSGHPLFRDTEAGFFGLDREGGTETLQRLDTPRNTLLVFGISAGEDGDLSFPFAGVNFFDFDFHGTGTQFNLAWAGPFVDIAWNEPNLLGSGPGGARPWSYSVQGTFNALESEDNNATAAGTLDEDEVDILRETVRGTLAIPIGSFLRFSLETRFTYQNFDRNDDTSVDFVLPSTNIEPVANLRGEFARLGWLAAVWGEWGRRSAWEPWGFAGQPFSGDDRDFTRLGIDVRKSFYVGVYHKFGMAVSGFEGRSLDRFSRFELGDFRAARVRGFNSSGIHFDRGLVAEASYAFPLGRSLRADLSIEQAFVHSGDDFGEGYERVTGSGLSFEFSGPWSTFVTVRVSAALSSTIPEKGNGGDLRVVFFKTFDKWSRKGGNRRPPPVPVMPGEAPPFTVEPPDVPGLPD